MAAIDRDLLLAEVKFYLGYLSEEEPGPNVLPDSIILSTAEIIILKVGDDDEFYAEVKCKTIKACAEQNQAMAAIDPNRGLRREESNKREIEWFNTDPVDFWGDYLDRLPTLCAAFGYCDLPSPNKGRFYTSVALPIRYPAGSKQIGSYDRTADCDGRPNYDDYE